MSIENTIVTAAPEWLNVHDAAKHLRVTEGYIYAAVEAGMIRHTRLMGKRSIRFKREWLESWMAEHERPVIHI
jgi:excisionase family DNA binding protein